MNKEEAEYQMHKRTLEMNNAYIKDGILFTDERVPLIPNEFITRYFNEKEKGEVVKDDLSSDGFINQLIEKREKIPKEEVTKVLKQIFNVETEEEIINKIIDDKIEKVIDRFTDKLDLAQQIIDVIPLYYDNIGNFWKWEHYNNKWVLIDEVDIMNLITNSSPANTINTKERSEILQALKQKARMNAPEPFKKTWIQFKDKIIDIETGDKFNASPKYFSVNPLPYGLGVSHDTPNIDRIMEEWVGKDNVLLLKQIIAYCMIPDYPIHRLFCFIGEGLNGKSKYLEMLRKIIGIDNCCSTELDVLLSSRFEVTRLHKKLVCQMGETNFNEMSKTSMLKKLTGGDLIGFEYKNKKPFEDVNYAKILISTNNLPATTDKTIGFYRRWLIIDFFNTFSEKKDILAEIPEEEYENINNQLVSILISLINKREFHNEGTIEERKEKYEGKSNFLEKFIKETTEESFDYYITVSDFNKNFREWCKENRLREISETNIGIQMKKLGIEQIRKYFDWAYDNKGGQIRCWAGLKWKNN